MSTIRVHAVPSRIDPSRVAEAGALPSTIISDQLDRVGFAEGIVPITPWSLGSLAGQALTVRTRPGDNAAVHMAISIAQPGDVLVIDAGGATDRAIMGEIVYRFAVARGIVGMVIDGVVRDVAAIAQGPIPVHAKGAAHPGPFKHGPGEVGGVVSVGGLVIRSGDVVVGDADGVTTIPVERLDRVIERGRAALAKEAEAMRLADAGAIDTSWIEQQLRVIRDGDVEEAEPLTPDRNYGMR